VRLGSEHLDMSLYYCSVSMALLAAQSARIEAEREILEEFAQSFPNIGLNGPRFAVWKVWIRGAGYLVGTLRLSCQQALRAKRCVK
jgi:hypothetical protein